MDQSPPSQSLPQINPLSPTQPIPIQETKSKFPKILLKVFLALVLILALGAAAAYFFVLKPKAQTSPIDLNHQAMGKTADYLKQYKDKHGKYPEKLTDLAADDFSIFPSDSFGNLFFYKTSEDGQSYELRSLGPDGQKNTADDILPPK